MIEDPDKQVTVSFPEGTISLTCSAWATFGCGVSNTQECAFYQEELTDECCIPIAPPSGPTPAIPTEPTPEVPTTEPATEAPSTIAPTLEGCTEFIVTFEQSADGQGLQGGQCVENEWAELGLTLSASEVPGIPCLLDSSDDGIENTALGSPNELCDEAGPGQGAGGAPGSEWENCSPQENVLVLRDGNEGGDGMITFEFGPNVEEVFDIGLLNIDRGGTTIFYETDVITRTVQVPDR